MHSSETRVREDEVVAGEASAEVVVLGEVVVRAAVVEGRRAVSNSVVVRWGVQSRAERD
jgi:hypothetical protein